MKRHHLHARRMALRRKQHGLTIAELMISMALGLLVILATTILLVSSKSTYTAQDDGTRLQETGRYALENIARWVRQAAFEDWDTEQAPIVADAISSANIDGLDAHSLTERTNGIESALSTSVNGSDVLALRFFGAGDGSILNCAGFAVTSAQAQEDAEKGRGWSIFYVADSDGEPELRCKYFGKNSWTSEAIARGVESFQVLYGVDTDADGLPNQFLTATAIDALDGQLILDGRNAIERAQDKNKKTYWKKVMVIKVAMLVRGSELARMDALTTQYDLFGKDYADAYATTDRGTRIREDELPPAVRNRLRKVFTQTIQLRNHPAGSAT
jgi:type IV pilus assembly protein PilW